MNDIMTNVDDFLDRLRRFVQGKIIEPWCDLWDNPDDTIRETYTDFMNNSQRTVGEEVDDKVRITAMGDDFITFLVRGRFDKKEIYERDIGVFIRAEVSLYKDRIEVKEWKTLLIDIKLKWKEAWEVKIGGGVENDTIIAHGCFAWIPTGLKIDVLVGGFNRKGIVVDTEVDLPVLIPIANTGLGIAGFEGDFAWDFTPRIENENPTAMDYIAWARNQEIDRWLAFSDPDRTVIGFGTGVDIADVFANGWIIGQRPAGLAFLFPGPIFITGGETTVINTDKDNPNGLVFESYIVFSSINGHWTAGTRVDVDLTFPSSGTPIVRIKGPFELFVDFDDAEAFYINFGTEKSPAKAELCWLDRKWGANFLSYSSESYLSINAKEIAIGFNFYAGTEKFDLDIISFKFKLGFGLHAKVGFKDFSIPCYIHIFGEIELGFLGDKLKFVIQVILDLHADIAAFKFESMVFKYKIKLPWPLDEVSDEYTLPEEEPDSEVAIDPVSPVSQPVSAIHPLSGRQWVLATTDSPMKVWPDIELVTAFSDRIIDTTNKVFGKLNNPLINGAFEVSHLIQTIKVYDLTRDELVPDVSAIWAENMQNELPNLHVFGRDSYSWLTPFFEGWDDYTRATPEILEQRFGLGDEEDFNLPMRFGNIVITPDTHGTISPVFEPDLDTRVLICDSFYIDFESTMSKSLFVDKLNLLVIEDNHNNGMLTTSMPVGYEKESVLELSEGLYLMQYSWDFTNNPTARIQINGEHNGVCLYAIQYRLVEAAAVGKYIVRTRSTLLPGSYRYILTGQTKSESQDSLQDDLATLDWQVEQDFNVELPLSLRPYIHYTTTGDSRFFMKATKGWNPTPYGVGFPCYQDYMPLVRFLAPYVSEMYPKLIFKIVYDNGTEYKTEADAVANTFAETTVPEVSALFINQYGGIIGSNEEIIMTRPPSEPGLAEIMICDTNDDSIVLDRWTCEFSRFHDFTHHIDLDPCKLNQLYGPTGIIAVNDYAIPALSGSLSSSGSEAELESVPVDWRLPNQLSNCLSSWETITGLSFHYFAESSGVNLNQINSPSPVTPVDTTVLEGLVDHQGRIIAFWLRTPEPLDWRRVSATAIVYHISIDQNNDITYEERDPLQVFFNLIPSPDAVSCFLVGVIGESSIYLPKGRYDFTLTFSAALEGLFPLHPRDSENVSFSIIQPSGPSWPTESGMVLLPGRVFEFIEEAERAYGIAVKVADLLDIWNDIQIERIPDSEKARKFNEVLNSYKQSLPKQRGAVTLPQSRGHTLVQRLISSPFHEYYPGLFYKGQFIKQQKARIKRKVRKPKSKLPPRSAKENKQKTKEDKKQKGSQIP